MNCVGLLVILQVLQNCVTARTLFHNQSAVFDAMQYKMQENIKLKSDIYKNLKNIISNEQIYGHNDELTKNSMDYYVLDNE
jgi:hypothetical protein